MQRRSSSSSQASHGEDVKPLSSSFIIIHSPQSSDASRTRLVLVSFYVGRKRQNKLMVSPRTVYDSVAVSSRRVPSRRCRAPRCSHSVSHRSPHTQRLPLDCPRRVCLGVAPVICSLMFPHLAPRSLVSSAVVPARIRLGVPLLGVSPWSLVWISLASDASSPRLVVPRSYPLASSPSPWISRIRLDCRAA